MTAHVAAKIVGVVERATELIPVVSADCETHI